MWMLHDSCVAGLSVADHVKGISTFLQDRFLFATGYPFCPIRETIDRYLALGFTDGVLHKIMRDNARRLFRLDGS
ncbi:MAG: amidohydrolase family protein [bacterium]|nr:amidohydrolase family protein [bacterium]MDE0287096.1 amidohydrolase family protein [bacterium]MDE0440134.1 amidohydrolase family protein [bacterium]